MEEQLSGNCLCGAVRFSTVGQLKRVSACYCSQCRRQNGGGPFYGAELQGELIIENTDHLQWYASSTDATRGFCKHCGSSLFWKSNKNPDLFDVSLGTLGDNHGLSLDAHIFVDNCPSYMSVPQTAPHMSEAQIFAKQTDDTNRS